MPRWGTWCATPGIRTLPLPLLGICYHRSGQKSSQNWFKIGDCHLFTYLHIRKGDSKLIYFHHDQHYELYNIREDLSEKRNLYALHRDVANRLAEELRSFLLDAKALMPTVKSTGLAVPLPGAV